MADLLTKEQALQALDQNILKDNQFVAGIAPTAEDNHVHDSIKRFDLSKLITPDKYPRLYSWHSFISFYTEAIRLSWADAKKENEELKNIITSLRAESNEDADARREKQKWDNYKPAGDKRPLDEFYDVAQVEYNECIGEPIDMYEDGEMIKYIVKESTSKFERQIEAEDIVHYLHETRYDNGQLVDFDEKRKAKERYEMANLTQHEHIRKAFKKMKKGEIAWIKYGPKYHGNIYHNYCKKDHLAKDIKLGDRIWIKLNVESLRRNPVYKDKDTYSGKVEFFNTVREISKELIVEEEYANAEKLYSRVLGEFKNIPKKIRDTLNQEQKDERIKIMVILNLNLSFCHLKRSDWNKAIKHAKDVVELDPNECKGHFRLATAYMQNNDLDQAKLSYINALKLKPNDKLIREDYNKLKEIKSKKEKEWYSKMSGFLGSEKIKKIEQKDNDRVELKAKIIRKMNRRREQDKENGVEFESEESEEDVEPAYKIRQRAE